MGKTLARFSSTGLMSHTAGYDTIWLSISSGQLAAYTADECQVLKRNSVQLRYNW